MKSIEEKMAFAHTIDFQQLFRHAELVSGTVLTFTDPILYENRGEVYADYKSNDIRHTCGVFGKILKSCVIKPFSGSVFEDRETGELKYWVKMTLQYQHHDGGSNGMDIFTARFIDGEWVYEDVQPRNW